MWHRSFSHQKAIIYRHRFQKVHVPSKAKYTWLKYHVVDWESIEEKEYLSFLSKHEKKNLKHNFSARLKIWNHIIDNLYSRHRNNIFITIKNKTRHNRATIRLAVLSSIISQLIVIENRL